MHKAWKYVLAFEKYIQMLLNYIKYNIRYNKSNDDALVLYVFLYKNFPLKSSYNVFYLDFFQFTGKY